MKELLCVFIFFCFWSETINALKFERSWINSLSYADPLPLNDQSESVGDYIEAQNDYDIEDNFVPKIKRPGPLLTMFPKPLPHPNNLTEENSGKPLILTPFLEAGKIDEAQDLAKVRGLSEDVTSYSGFFTTNKTCDSNLFFWYFPSKVTLKWNTCIRVYLLFEFILY